MEICLFDYAPRGIDYCVLTSPLINRSKADRTCIGLIARVVAQTAVYSIILNCTLNKVKSHKSHKTNTN